MHQKIQNELIGVKKEIKEFQRLREDIRNKSFQLQQQREKQQMNLRQKKVQDFLDGALNELYNKLKQQSIGSGTNQVNSMQQQMQQLKNFLLQTLLSGKCTDYEITTKLQQLYKSLLECQRRKRSPSYHQSTPARIAYLAQTLPQQYRDQLAAETFRTLSNCLAIQSSNVQIVFERVIRPGKFVILVNSQDRHAIIESPSRRSYGLYRCCSTQTQLLQNVGNFYYDLLFVAWLIVKYQRIPTFQKDQRPQFQRRLPAILKYIRKQNHYLLYWILTADNVDINLYVQQP